MISSNFDLAIARLGTHGRLTTEVDELPAEVTLVLRNVGIQGRGQARIVPSCCFGVVIHKVDACGRGKAHFPPRGQGPKLGHRLRL